MPDDRDDKIKDLRDRIRATQAAAERLAGELPLRGGSGDPRVHRDRADEVQALASLLHTMRDLVPPELQDQFREVMRQVLLLLRALVDYWIERLEADAAAPPAERQAGPPVVEEIPVD